MKLPALAIVSAFALGIACALSPEIAHRSSSHQFVAFLLCIAATSLLIGTFLQGASNRESFACSNR
jgi:low affinity Fe/Cu permease